MISIGYGAKITPPMLGSGTYFEMREVEARTKIIEVKTYFFLLKQL